MNKIFMHLRQRSTVGLFLLILLLAACGQAEEPPPARPTAEPEPAAAEETENDADAETETASATTAQQPSLTVLADGEIKAGRPVLALSFEASGRLLELNFQPGDVVQEGEVIASLDDQSLQEAVTSAELQLAVTQNNLLKAETVLDDLLTWEPDENAVAVAEANVASAEASLANAQTQDAAAGNGLTSAAISIDQAERELASAQEAYDNAFSPGREWEVFYDEPICDPGEPEPCTGITWAERIENDREFSTTRLKNAEEQLAIARANYNLEASRINNNSAVGAQASLVAAQKELDAALTGPTESEIATAQFDVEQAKLGLEQDEFNLQQAQEALAQAQLIAPWTGTVLSVDVATGAMVSPGMNIVTLLDTERLEFHTTNLSERDLAQISAGQEALVTLKTYSDEVFAGTVLRIGVQAAGTVGDAAVFPVIIELEAAELPVRPGMTGRVEIVRE